MSFYNTGNPVPSIDPRDLDDNAKHIDEIVNSTFATFVDRLGVTRLTLAGVESALGGVFVVDALAGDGVTDAYSVIQAALNSAGVILIPEGTYRNATAPFRIFSNTTLILSPGAKIVNDIPSADPMQGVLFANGPIGGTVTGGYGNTENINIVGGIFDGTPRAAAGFLTAFFNMAHAKGISFYKCSFTKHAGNTHCVEINSSRDVLFDQCEFTTFIPNGAALGTREFINIDQSTASGFPAFGPWDDTPCHNITVRDCVFSGGDVAVGSHNSAPVNPHTKITVTGCDILNMTSRGLNFYFWDDSLVANNKINTTVVGIRALSCENTTIENNKIDGMTDLGFSVGGFGGFPNKSLTIRDNKLGVCTGFNINASESCNIIDNIFNDISLITGPVFLSLTGINGTSFRGNKVSVPMGTKQMFLDFPAGTPGAFIEVDNKFYIVVADDGVGVIPDTRRGMNQGMMVVGTQSGTTTAGPLGFYWTRTTVAGPVCRILDQYNTGTFAVAITALTGTTGTDGTTTVSAFGTSIYIENRSGAIRTYEVSFL